MIVKNIKGLVQVRPQAPLRIFGDEMADLPVLDDAFLIIKDGIIEDFGRMEEFHEQDFANASLDEVIDAKGKYVLPTFVDSHTHLVFAAYREGEFVDKIKGLTYAEIADKGGGILNSANKLHKMSEEELFDVSLPRAWEILSYGTAAVEIKSGYGLSTEDELKMLRVARKIG